MVKTHFKVRLGPQSEVWARINGDAHTEELAKALMRGGFRRMTKGVSAGQEACGDLLDFVQGHSALRFECWEEHEELDGEGSSGFRGKEADADEVAISY